MTETRRDWTTEAPALVRSLVLPFVAAAIGNAATLPNLDRWYEELAKPAFTPPKSAFGPAWTTLYLLMGAAHYLVNRAEATPGAKRAANALYGLQLGLNALWSVLFFGLRSPLAGLIEIVALVTAITLTVFAFARISKPAALLLAPYLLWTAFAATLNLSIWRLNQ
jgi:tryptophan-rich sensory protein